VAKLARAGALNWCTGGADWESTQNGGHHCGTRYAGRKGAWPGGPITTIPVAPTTDVRSKTS